MENRLCLNKRLVYELPDEVIIGEYRYSKDIRRYKEPDFKPDICLTTYGSIRVRDKKKALVYKYGLKQKIMS